MIIDDATKLAARLTAIETMLVGVMADAIIKAERPAVAMAGVRGYLDAAATGYAEQAKDLGEKLEGWDAALKVAALYDLRDRIDMVVATGLADGTGKRN